MALKFIVDDTRWRVYNFDEVYDGSQTSGTWFVVKVDDLVFDPSQGWLRVTGVSSNVPIYERFLDPTVLSYINSSSIDVGLGTNYSAVTSRVFVDKTVTPAIMAFDTRMNEFGSQAIYYRVFKGTDVTDEGNVISRKYDVNGNITDDILELNTVTSSPGYREIPFTKIEGDLAEGDTVTLVIYGSNGVVVSDPKTFVVRLTSVIKPGLTTDDRIERISLVCDALDPDDDTRILNPVAIPVSTSGWRCKVHYQSGATTLLQIDGVNVRLWGIEIFNKSIAPGKKNLVLAYYPGTDKPAINVTTAALPSLVAEYTIENYVTESDFVYKLWVVPTFVSTSEGYSLSFWLTNLDRTTAMDVTDYVMVTTDSGNFEPTNYGNTQELTLRLELNGVVSVITSSYVLVQTLNLYLDTPSTLSGTAWSIDYAADGSGTLGTEARVQASNVSGTFNMANDCSSQDIWLQRFYYEADPLYDSSLYSGPVEPTHMRLKYGNGKEVLVDVTQWDNSIVRADSTNFAQFDTMVIEWLFHNDTTDEYQTLGYTAMLIEVVS